jgi:hypothetical protein
VAPDFTAPEAIVDIESRVNKIEEDTSKASWNALLSKILCQVCPNFLNDPYKTLSWVHQHTIINGNPVTQTVRQYHDQIQLVISTFDKSVPSWPANPFRTFMDNLSPEIKKTKSNKTISASTPKPCQHHPTTKSTLSRRATRRQTLPKKNSPKIATLSGTSYHRLTDSSQSPAFHLA